MATTQLSGLVSGFDWKSFVDQMMELERVPITRMESEQTLNSRKVSIFESLGERITSLQTAAKALQDKSLYSSRSAATVTSSSTWKVSASAGAPVGSYSISVSQLASAAKRNGSTDIGRGLATTSDVSGITLADLPLSSAVTAGTFTVNGKSVTVALTDSLDAVFQKISTATSGAVTASYNPAGDTVALSSSSEIVLGATNDTSNFLSVFQLANNGSSSITSAASLGKVKTSATIANAGLRSAITAVDGSGNGSFSINGVAITYNVNTDSIAGIISKINASSAGVTASYDTSRDQMVLTNNSTGDTGIGVVETSGGLMDALGLTSSSTLTRGKNTLFTVDGGPTLSTSSTTLTAAATGITGLTIKPSALGTEVVNVTADTDSIKTAIKSFVSSFNDIQTYIEDQTAIKTTDGKVTAATMSSNREIQSWASQLRRTAFSSVSGLSGTISRLESLGLDFTSSTGSAQLQWKDEGKLTTALSDNLSSVQEFFAGSSSGFAYKFDSFFTTTLGATGENGSINDQIEKLTKSNDSLDEQIAAVQRRLDQRRDQLTASFVAMETAQSKIKQMQSQLTNAFSSSSSSS